MWTQCWLQHSGWACSAELNATAVLRPEQWCKYEGKFKKKTKPFNLKLEDPYYLRVLEKSIILPFPLCVVLWSTLYPYLHASTLHDAWEMFWQEPDTTPVKLLNLERRRMGGTCLLVRSHTERGNRITPRCQNNVEGSRFRKQEEVGLQQQAELWQCSPSWGGYSRCVLMGTVVSSSRKTNPFLLTAQRNYVWLGRILS